jgi:hypothetical protein
VGASGLVHVTGFEAAAATIVALVDSEKERTRIHSIQSQNKNASKAQK